MADPTFARGSCRCGEVTLTITEKPKMMMQCHCLDCQKATGTGHTSQAYFDEKDVLIKGEVVGHTVTANSGNKMTRHFCQVCGSRLFGRNSGRPGLISVEVGCLDDHSWYSPQAVLFTSRQNDWDITAGDIPHFDKMPPSKS